MAANFLELHYSYQKNFGFGGKVSNFGRPREQLYH